MNLVCSEAAEECKAKPEGGGGSETDEIDQGN
jgi:hypothetical protein